MKDKMIPARKDCPAAEKWQLSDIYATREDWQKARDGIPAELAAIQSFKGRLHDPQALLDCLTKQDEMEIALSAVFAWARMMADTDTANQEHQADAASVMPLLDKVGAATAFIEPEQSLPANGQGAVGIECRLDDHELHALLAPLEHAETRIRVLTERAMNRALQGGCQVPIGAYALVQGEEVWLRGLVGSPDGSRVIRDEIRGPLAEGEALGHTLAQRLLAAGADVILAEVYRA